MIILYIAIFVLAFFVLARSSDFLVRSLTGLAKLFSLSEYMVSFIFMSMATSIPELFVGLSAAIKNIPEFSLGTVVGSNLVNITLVLGITIILGKGLSVESKISRRNFWVISILSFFPFLLAIDGLISRGDGVVLLLLFVFYITQLKREKEYFTKTVNHLPKSSIIASTLKNLSGFFAGVALLIASSMAIVWSGEQVASYTSMGLFLFSIIFVAIGTSLPEIFFGIRSRMMGHDSMAVGNSLGSNAFNACLIIGLTSLIRPISVDISLSLLGVTLFTLLGIILFNFFVYSKELLSRKEGIILLLIYFAFLVFQYFI